MKGSICIDGRIYLLSGRDGQVQITSPTGKPVASNPTWKKFEWHDETLTDEMKTKVISVVDGFRRMARYSKFSVVMG